MQEIEMNPSFAASCYGIRLSYVKQLIENWNITNDMSTEHVCENFIKPITQEVRLPYCNYLIQSDLGTEQVRSADIFISHTWGNPFKKVIEVIESQLKDSNLFIWMDIFCHNQHLYPEDFQFQDWIQSFKMIIREIREVGIVILDWENPSPLKRCWCLYEIFVSTTNKCNLQLLSNHDLSEASSLTAILQRIDMKESEAKNEEDKTRIFQILEEETTFLDLDIAVIKAMKNWFLFQKVQPLLMAALSLIGLFRPVVLLLAFFFTLALIFYEFKVLKKSWAVVRWRISQAWNILISSSCFLYVYYIVVYQMRFDDDQLNDYTNIFLYLFVIISCSGYLIKIYLRLREFQFAITEKRNMILRRDEQLETLLTSNQNSE